MRKGSLKSTTLSLNRKTFESDLFLLFELASILIRGEFILWSINLNHIHEGNP
jgi:hypothetical protein